MRNRCAVRLWLILRCDSSAAQPETQGSASEQFWELGAYWDGAGTGGFELTLEKGKDNTGIGNGMVMGDSTYRGLQNAFV